MKISDVIKHAFKRYFLIGLIVTVPFIVTVKFLFFIIDSMDQILAINRGRWLFVIPEKLHPDHILGFHLPGLGVVFTVLIILGIGILSRNYFGNQMIKWSERMMERLPGGRVIYKVVKEILQTYVNKDRSNYSRVVLIEYPRKGIHTLALVTGVAAGEVQEKTGKKMINVFIPTTPNPTSGFYLMVAESEAITLDFTIEEAFKLIMTAGMTAVERKKPELKQSGHSKT